MKDRPVQELLGLRFERFSPLAMAALACALAALWLFGRRYAGITHDATLYAVQALRRIDAASYAQDLFFAYGAQDEYTIFPRLYAPLIDLFGSGAAAMLVTVVGQCAFLAASAALVMRLTAAWPIRWWSLALLAIVSGYYGGVGTFRMAEPFATARTLAEPLVIASLAGTLAGRVSLAFVALAGAAVLHPLVAAPGVAVIFFWHAANRPRLLWAVPVAAVLAAAFAAAGSGRRFDGAWLAAVLERSPHLFIALWQAPDWARLFWDLSCGWLALQYIDSAVRRLALIVAGTALAGIAFTGIAVDLFGSVLAAGLQMWRAHWLLHLLAVMLVPVAVAGLWRRGGAARAAAALLAASCCFGRAELPAGAAMALLSVLCDASEGRWPGWMGGKLLRVAMVAAIGAATVGLLFDVQARLPPAYSVVPPAAWKDYLPAAGSVGGLVPLALLLWLAACSRFRAAAAVLAGAALLGSIAAWDARTPWSRFVEGAGGQDNPFRKLLTPHAQVFWPAPNGAVWLVLRTATWFTVDQGAGIAFHRATAIEYSERKLASESLRSRIQNCAMAYPAGCRIEGPVAIDLCRQRQGPDYLVLNGRIDGHAAIAEWRIPQLIGSNQSTVFLYACREFAGGNMK